MTFRLLVIHFQDVSPAEFLQLEPVLVDDREQRHTSGIAATAAN
jgi:hypothetical protein